jgi:archaeal cell division control protein 6
VDKIPTENDRSSPSEESVMVPPEAAPSASRPPAPVSALPPVPTAPPIAPAAPAAPGSPSTSELFDTLLRPGTDLYKGNREILRESYIPSRLPHRENQLKQVGEVLAPALRGELPSNLLIYGKIGTGKTAVVQQVRQEFQRRSELPKRLTFITVNCGNIDTPYSLLQTIGNALAAKESERIPTGWSLDRVQGAVRELMDAREGTLILLLDEIDRLVARSGDGLLYTLSQLNTELSRARLCLVGISNDLKFTNNLDARVRSRLNEEKILFPPYGAQQLEDILRDRAHEVFRDGVVDPGVLERCAAYAALENGDARRALALLRLAAEMAERDRSKRISVDHVVKAKSRLELDIIVECCRTLPSHCKVLLYAILQAYERRRGAVATGEIYEGYCRLCQRLGLQPLHARSISNYLSELENLGLIRATIVSRGRGGRTREILVEVPIAETMPALAEDPLLASLARPRGLNQTILTNFDNPNRGFS